MIALMCSYEDSFPLQLNSLVTQPVLPQCADFKKKKKEEVEAMEKLGELWTRKGV